MDQDQIQSVLNGLPHAVLQTLNEFRKHPTPRNEAYFVGYIKAKRECGCISEEAYGYLLAMSGSMIRGERVQDLVEKALRTWE